MKTKPVTIVVNPHTYSNQVDTTCLGVLRWETPIVQTALRHLFPDGPGKELKKIEVTGVGLFAYFSDD
jgi:hypothetical protein